MIHIDFVNVPLLLAVSCLTVTGLVPSNSYALPTPSREIVIDPGVRYLDEVRIYHTMVEQRGDSVGIFAWTWTTDSTSTCAARTGGDHDSLPDDPHRPGV